jgi:hypothetical protein
VNASNCMYLQSNSQTVIQTVAHTHTHTHTFKEWYESVGMIIIKKITCVVSPNMCSVQSSVYIMHLENFERVGLRFILYFIYLQLFVDKRVTDVSSLYYYRFFYVRLSPVYFLFIFIISLFRPNGATGWYN